MKLLLKPLFLICAVAFLLHQALQYVWKVRLPLADAYLDNLVALPVILTLLQWERIYLFRRGQAYRLSGTEVVLATLYVSLVTELLFPVLSNRFTADPLDLLCYAVGAAVYYFSSSSSTTTEKGGSSS